MFVILHKDLERIKELTKNLPSICDWFVDDKLSIQFGEDKTKSIFFSTKNRKKEVESLDIQYGAAKIKQYSKVTYLGYELDESLLILKFTNNINGTLKFP